MRTLFRQHVEPVGGSATYGGGGDVATPHPHSSMRRRRPINEQRGDGPLRESSQTREEAGTQHQARRGERLKFAFRLEIDLPAHPHDTDAVWVVAVFILKERLGRPAGRRQAGMVLVVST